MQVVIEIHEKIYEKLAVKQEENIPWDYVEKIITAITYGTPLPKGHGNLIDTNEITAFRELECNGHNVKSLDEFTTIIEADKESKEWNIKNF